LPRSCLTPSTTGRILRANSPFRPHTKKGVDRGHSHTRTVLVASPTPDRSLVSGAPRVFCGRRPGAGGQHHRTGHRRKRCHPSRRDGHRNQHGAPGSTGHRRHQRSRRVSADAAPDRHVCRAVRTPGVRRPATRGHPSDGGVHRQGRRGAQAWLAAGNRHRLRRRSRRRRRVDVRTNAADEGDAGPDSDGADGPAVRARASARRANSGRSRTTRSSVHSDKTATPGSRWTAW
jgi:hypothetical protein